MIEGPLHCICHNHVKMLLSLPPLDRGQIRTPPLLLQRTCCPCAGCAKRDRTPVLRVLMASSTVLRGSTTSTEVSDTTQVSRPNSKSRSSWKGTYSSALYLCRWHRANSCR